MNRLKQDNRSKQGRSGIGVAIAVALAVLASGAQAAEYVYKGELLDRGEPAHGDYDLRIRAYADAQGARPLGSAFEAYGVEVNQGSFSTELSLPDTAADTLWLGVSVRRKGDDSEFKPLGGLEPISVKGGACPAAWELEGNIGLPANARLGTNNPAEPLRIVAGRRVATLQGDTTAVGVVIPPNNNANYYRRNTTNLLFGSDQNTFSTSKVGQTILGGGAEILDGPSLTAFSGDRNATAGHFATTVGGAGNRAEGDFSFAAGYRARAAHHGSFIWVCRDCGQVPPSPANPNGTWGETVRDNEFAVAASGGLRFYTGPNFSGRGLLIEPTGTTRIVASTGGQAFEVRNDGSLYFNRPNGDFSLGANGYARIWTANLPSGALIAQGLEMNTDGSVYFRTNATGSSAVGVRLASGGGSWISMSDRNAKTNIEPVDAEDVLARVLELPIATWNYTTTSDAERHMGPMAQDFHAAFGLNGDDDKGITGIDADGVALAAIQGLAARLESENAQLREHIDAQQEMIETLHARLTALEAGRER